MGRTSLQLKLGAVKSASQVVYEVLFLLRSAGASAAKAVEVSMMAVDAIVKNLMVGHTLSPAAAVDIFANSGYQALQKTPAWVTSRSNKELVRIALFI